MGQATKFCKTNAPRTSIKPHAQEKILDFLIRMAFIMAWPNFEKGLKISLSWLLRCSVLKV
jgi:hypothetical protein